MRMGLGVGHLVVGLSLTVAAAASAGPFTVTEHGDDRIRVVFDLGAYELEPVDVDGEPFVKIVTGGTADALRDPGQPLLPRFSTLIGLPPDAVATVRVADLETSRRTGVAVVPATRSRIAPPEENGGVATPYEEDVISPEYYDRAIAYPRDIAVLGNPGRIRNLRVVPLNVVPFRTTGGATPTLEAFERIVLDIQIDRASSGERRWAPAVEGADVEPLYGPILNRDASRSWRVREVAPVAPSLRSGRFGAAHPEVKIRIAYNRNEWVRVRWSDLSAAGWAETPAVADVQLTSREYDASALPSGDPFVKNPVDIHLVDVDGDNLFDDGDWFAFYAMDAPTQRNWTPFETRYTGENVYWLTWESGAGTAMSTRDGAPGDIADVDAEPTEFESWHHVEENNNYYFLAFNDDDRPGLRQTVDHLFMTDWISILDFDVRVPFDIVDPVPGTDLGLRTELRAMFLDSSRKTARVSVAMGTGAPGTLLPDFPVEIDSDLSYVYDSGGISLSGYVGEGRHELILGQADNAEEEYVLNWFDFGYRRQFVAHGNGLQFDNAGAMGRVRYTISGFDDPEVLAFDTTDPDRPIRLTGGTLAGGVFTVEDDVDGDRSYSVQSTAAMPVLTTELELDRPSNLRDLSGADAELDADYLVVVYDEFAEALTPWVELRESQGHVVEVARVSDVYDEFSGGLFSPNGIREFVRYAYRMHPTVGGRQPLYLLLVGDASEDYWGVVRDFISIPTSPIISEPNYVPGYMILGDASTGGSNEPLILTDFWYIANPDGNDDPDNQFFSSMMVGRLPTESVLQTEVVVEKILTYEAGLEEEEGQEWRNRGMFIADDEWSGAGAGGKGFGAYRRNSREREFRTTSEGAADSVMAAGLYDFEIENFFLTDILDPIPELGRDLDTGTTTCGWRCTYQYTRNCMDLEGMLIERLNLGHLFVTYQGHGNRNLVSHEYTLMGNGAVGAEEWPCPPDGSVNDVEDRFNNGDRLPVWFFYACHVGEMARRDEGKSQIGDCLGERLLLYPDGGSIATVASTGYEWLTSNDIVQYTTFSSWFGAAGRLADDITDDPHTLLGEIMIGAKNLLAATGAQANEGMVESYITLGDPGLRIDIAPPRIRVWQDAGTDPWNDPDDPEPVANGSTLRAMSVDEPSTFFAGTLFDEAPIDSVWLSIERDGGSTVVPPSAYELVAGEVDEIGGIERVRSFTVRYDHPVDTSDYDLVMHAVDINRREREFRMEARVDVAFSRVDGSGDVVPLPAGSLVRGGETIRVDVTAPVGLLASDVDLLLDGVALSGSTEMLEDGGAARGGDRSYGWRLTRSVPTDISRGTHTLALRWPNGEEMLTEEITVSSEAFRLDRYFAYPSPFADETSFFYRVTQPVNSATVKIYTVAGRLIRTLDQPFPSVDLNRIAWDGRDEDGDHVANGTYLYRLELVGPDGKALVEQGKVARVLGHQVRAQ